MLDPLPEDHQARALLSYLGEGAQEGLMILRMVQATHGKDDRHGPVGCLLRHAIIEDRIVYPAQAARISRKLLLQVSGKPVRDGDCTSGHPGE